MFYTNRSRSMLRDEVMRHYCLAVCKRCIAVKEHQRPEECCMPKAATDLIRKQIATLPAYRYDSFVVTMYRLSSLIQSIINFEDDRFNAERALGYVYDIDDDAIPGLKKMRSPFLVLASSLPWEEIKRRKKQFLRAAATVRYLSF